MRDRRFWKTFTQNICEQLPELAQATFWIVLTVKELLNR